MKMWVWSLGQDTLEEGMATHSSLLAWRIPWTGDPGGLQSMGSQRIGHDWRQWHPTPVFLPGKSHRRRSLVGCRPWGRRESDTTERLHFPFSLLCIGEGNGNPLQCSCLENPRDGGAWWATVYGVTQSRTRLKRLSSSSRSHLVLTQTGKNIIESQCSAEWSEQSFVKKPPFTKQTAREVENSQP